MSCCLLINGQKQKKRRKHYCNEQVADNMVDDLKRRNQEVIIKIQREHL